jgi:hypothetical protein
MIRESKEFIEIEVKIMVSRSVSGRPKTGGNMDVL